jgi:hypothetical protein
MFFESGLWRHSEVNLQLIITACIKGGNSELQKRAAKALKTKRRMKPVRILYGESVLVLAILGGIRIF